MAISHPEEKPYAESPVTPNNGFPWLEVAQDFDRYALGVGSQMRTQNGTLVNGHMDSNLRFFGVPF